MFDVIYGRPPLPAPGEEVLIAVNGRLVQGDDVCPEFLDHQLEGDGGGHHLRQ